MMKVNFLKRLESSIESFEISLDRTARKIEELIKRIKHFQSSKDADKTLSLFDLEPNEAEFEENDEIKESWQVGKKLKFDLEDLKLDEWLKDLEGDRQCFSFALQ